MKRTHFISQFLCVRNMAMAKLSWPSLSILKEINPEYSLEGLMLKLQYFGHLMQKTMKKKESTHRKRTWCWERLRAGGERDDRGWDDWMASPTQWAWVWAISGRQIVKDRGAWHVAVHGVTKHQTQFNTTSLLVKILSCILPVWN